MEGLEPPCLAALDPKSSASTNFATSAYADDSATIPIAIGTATSALILSLLLGISVNGVQRKEDFYSSTIFFIYFVIARWVK